jgi:hypothetical protein
MDALLSQIGRVGVYPGDPGLREQVRNDVEALIEPCDLTLPLIALLLHYGGQSVISDDHVPEVPLPRPLIHLALSVNILPAPLLVRPVNSNTYSLQAIQIDVLVSLALLEDLHCHVIVPIYLYLRPMRMWPWVYDIRQGHRCRTHLLLRHDTPTGHHA